MDLLSKLSHGIDRFLDATEERLDAALVAGARAIDQGTLSIGGVAQVYSDVREAQHQQHSRDASRTAENSEAVQRRAEEMRVLLQRNGIDADQMGDSERAQRLIVDATLASHTAVVEQHEDSGREMAGTQLKVRRSPPPSPTFRDGHAVKDGHDCAALAGTLTRRRSPHDSSGFVPIGNPLGSSQSHGGRLVHVATPIPLSPAPRSASESPQLGGRTVEVTILDKALHSARGGSSESVTLDGDTYVPALEDGRSSSAGTPVFSTPTSPVVDEFGGSTVEVEHDSTFLAVPEAKRGVTFVAPLKAPSPVQDAENRDGLPVSNRLTFAALHFPSTSDKSAVAGSRVHRSRTPTQDGSGRLSPVHVEKRPSSAGPSSSRWRMSPAVATEEQFTPSNLRMGGGRSPAGRFIAQGTTDLGAAQERTSPAPHETVLVDPQTGRRTELSNFDTAIETCYTFRGKEEGENALLYGMKMVAKLFMWVISVTIVPLFAIKAVTMVQDCLANRRVEKVSHDTSVAAAQHGRRSTTDV